MKNKQGAYLLSSKLIYIMLALLILTISYFLFVGEGVNLIQSKAYTLQDTELDLLTARVVNVCFAHETSGGFEPNVLDYDKITTEQLELCLDGTFRVDVKSIDGSFPSIGVRTGVATPTQQISRYTLVYYQEHKYPAIITTQR